MDWRSGSNLLFYYYLSGNFDIYLYTRCIILQGN